MSMITVAYYGPYSEKQLNALLAKEHKTAKKLAAVPEGKIKSANNAVEAEKSKCDEFQKLLWGRSASLARVRAVRESLIPGMWITEWMAIPAPKDNPEGNEGIRVTIRGWRDSMTKAEADWSAKNGGKKSTSAEIVVESLKGRSCSRMCLSRRRNGRGGGSATTCWGSSHHSAA